MEFDLHIHSKFSFDSKSDPAGIVEAARKKGLHGIAVTDHDSIEGGLAAREIAAGTGLVVIVGMEATTEVGDIIGLFLKEPVQTKNPLEFVAGVKEQEGVVYVPHPFRYGSAFDEELFSKVDGVEGYNGRSSRMREVDPTYGERRVEKVARQFNLFALSGSDAHSCREIGRGRTIVPAMTEADLKREILRKNTLLCGPRRSALAHALSEIGGTLTDQVRVWVDTNRRKRALEEKEEWALGGADPGAHDPDREDRE